MKPHRAQFKMFVDSTIHSNKYLHAPPSAPDSLCRMVSLSAFPEDVAHFDQRAAELLQKARDAHDALTAYLRSRNKDGDT